MTDQDLRGKGLTQRDVVRQALKRAQLGPQASLEAVRDWIKWTYPMVTLDDSFSDEVAQARRDLECEC